MPLTSKQENFCLVLLETGNATEAYRQSYNTKNMKPETINKRASELQLSGDITGRMAELKQPAIEAAQLTLESHLNKLAEIRDAAIKDEQWAAATTAETNRGKCAGLYIERTENINRNYVVDNKPLSVEEWQNQHTPSGNHNPDHSTH